MLCLVTKTIACSKSCYTSLSKFWICEDLTAVLMIVNYSGILHVDWYTVTNVSEQLAASIFRAQVVLSALDPEIYSIKLHPNNSNCYESTLHHIPRVFQVYQTSLEFGQLRARLGRRHPCAGPGCRCVFIVYFNRESFGICGAFRKCSRKLDGTEN